MIRRLVARLYWRCSPWRLVSEPGPDRPTVLIGAPHTSNWDFVLMLAVAWRLNVRIHWLGKESLFAGWRGPFMRMLGGIPVNRKNPAGLVEDLVERMSRGEVFGLVLTPDGTRGAHTHWKSGFYRIAQQAALPVTMAYIDRTTMTTGIGPTFDLSGDIDADMEIIRAFYADKSGFIPSKRVEPRLKDETTPS